MSNIKIFLPVMALALNSTFTRGADKPGELPFKLVQGFGIVVRGEIGSKMDMNFLLDTGAVPSVLGQRAAAQLDIRDERGSLTILNKESQAEYVTVDEVQFGWIRAARLPMVVVELAHLEQRLLLDWTCWWAKTSVLTISIERLLADCRVWHGTRWMWKLSPLRVRPIGWFPSRWVAWDFVCFWIQAQTIWDCLRHAAQSRSSLSGVKR